MRTEKPAPTTRAREADDANRFVVGAGRGSPHRYRACRRPPVRAMRRWPGRRLRQQVEDDWLQIACRAGHDAGGRRRSLRRRESDQGLDRPRNAVGGGVDPLGSRHATGGWPVEPAGGAFEIARGAAASQRERRRLYLDTRWIVRRLFFSHPLLDFDRLLLVKRFTQETYPDVCLNHMPWVSRPGGDLCVLSAKGPGASGPPLARRSATRGRIEPSACAMCSTAHWGRATSMGWTCGSAATASFSATRGPRPTSRRRGWLDRRESYRAPPHRGADPLVRNPCRRARPAPVDIRRVERPGPDLAARRPDRFRL